MGFFFLMLTICIFFIAIINTYQKLVDNTFALHKSDLKRGMKKILIWGLLSILLISTVLFVSSINEDAKEKMSRYDNTSRYIEARETFDNTLPLTFIFPIVYVIVMIIFLFQCAMITSEKDVIREKKAQKMQEELSEYIINREVRYNNNVVILDNKHEVVIIEDTLNMTYDIIKYRELLNCEILENNSTVMTGGVGRAVVGGMIAGGVGAIVGANTRKSKVINSLTIRIITSNSRKSSYILKLQDENLSNEAYNFMNEVYGLIINLINQYSKKL